MLLIVSTSHRYFRSDETYLRLSLSLGRNLSVARTKRICDYRYRSMSFIAIPAIARMKLIAIIAIAAITVIARTKLIAITYRSDKNCCDYRYRSVAITAIARMKLFAITAIAWSRFSLSLGYHSCDYRYRLTAWLDGYWQPR
jgi:hypothetical protein